MRHVPEEELHAYLDQALSRSQCVEIETHLATCAHCHDQRDEIAALRDRTTALLGQLTPRSLILPPAFETLAARKPVVAAAAVWRVRFRRAGLWAASLAAAVGAGWAGRSAFDPHSALPVAVSSLPRLPAALLPDPVADLAQQATPIPIQEHPTRFVATRPAGYRQADAIAPAPTLQLVAALVPMREASPAGLFAVTHPDTHSPFDRIWRSVSWEEALQIAGSGLPFIEGLPVVGVLLQPGAAGERPTVIVAQQDPGGEVIQSIEGPVAKVSELLDRQATPDLHASEPARTTPDYVEGPGGVRRTLRILSVTGRLPVDSLNALARLATIR